MSEDVQEGEKTGHVLGCSRLRAEGFGEHQTPGLHTRAGRAVRRQVREMLGRGDQPDRTPARAPRGLGGSAHVWPPPGWGEAGG